MLERLAPADYATLGGLGLGWTATVLLFGGRADAATLILLVAFLLDKADGVLARRGYGSSFGPQLDALADVMIYLVPTAVLVSVTFAIPLALATVIGASVLVFGVLRLARHCVDRRGSAGGAAYYRGITAFHVATWALIVRLIVDLMGIPAVVGAFAVGVTGPLMIAPVRVYTTRRQYIGAVIVGISITVGVGLELVGST